MAFYIVVSPQKVYVDYLNGTVLGFTTGQVFDADPALPSVGVMLRANPSPITAYTPSVAFTALPAGEAGGAATLDEDGKIPVAQLPDADALDAEVDAAIAAHVAEVDPHDHATAISDAITAHNALEEPHATSNSLPKWLHFSMDFSDFAAAALTSSPEVYSLPAGGVIHAVKIKHSEAFAGGDIASYTISVGIVGTEAKYAAAFNVFQAPGATVQQLTGTLGTENHGAATSIKATAVSTVGDLDEATDGAVDIWILTSVAMAFEPA